MSRPALITLETALAAIAFVSALTASGCAGGTSNRDELPSWIPGEIAGLTIRPADGAERMLGGEEAIATVRRKLFTGLDASPDEEPLTFLTRITGVVHGEGSVVVPPSGQAVFPKVDNRLAWLVIWRGVEGRAFDPPFFSDPNHVSDFVVFVDAQTGEVLYKVFLSGNSRLG